MSIWQTKSWQEMLFKSKQIEKIIELDNIFIEKRSIGLGQFGLFVLGINEVKEVFLNNAKTLCKEEKSLFIQFETINYENKKTILFPDIKEGYFKKFITPYTAIVDLNLTLDDILSKMKPKGRYNIKLAEKKGVVVSEVEKTRENIEVFYNLMLETTSRDSFNGNSLDYYFTFLNEVKESKLFIAYIDSTPISAGIFTYSNNEAIYYYGASTSDSNYRNLMAPYLLQWKAICMGKELNCKIYDFLGVASPGDDESPLKGVTDFKTKFTSNIVNVSESYIFINNKIKYCLIQLLRKIKR